MQSSGSRALLTLLSMCALCLFGCGTQQAPTPVPQPPPAPVPSEPEPPPPIVPGPRYEPVAWSDVAGWSADQVQEAWGAFLQSCRVQDLQLQWGTICAQAQQESVTTAATARAFFEARFTPYRLTEVQSDGASSPGLVTGYYEPLLQGSRKRTKTFNVPLYGPPNDMLTIDLGDLYPELKGRRVRGRVVGRKVVPYFERAEIVAKPPLLRGHELLWVNDAVDAFFLEVQGSGRVQLRDGKTVRITYADQNGQPYRPIGRYLVDQGAMPLETVSLQSIRQWIKDNPQRMQEVLNANPSVVFFREERIADPTEGPKGTLGVPLTAGRSIAVDPRYLPLGAPVFIATTYPQDAAPLQRLMLAQDTGGAIRGLVRADLFWGFGASAGESAGKMKQPAQMWLLWPREQELPTLARAAPDSPAK
jgi:membrane-bound lytic murein transglycosylase A